MTITLEDVAVRLGIASGLEQIAERFGAEVVTDWSGRLAVSKEDAKKSADGMEAARRENAELHRDFEAYEREWQRRRHEVGEEAFQRVWKENQDRILSTPPSGDYAEGGYTYSNMAVWPGGREEAQRAAEEARAKFEKKNPFLSLDEFERKWRKSCGEKSSTDFRK